MEKLNHKAFLNNKSDLFAYIFLRQLELEKNLHLLSASSGPKSKWKASLFYKKFLKELSAPGNASKTSNSLEGFRSAIPLLSDEELSTLSSKDFSSYRALNYLFRESNIELVVKNSSILNAKSDGPAFEFSNFNYLWKYSPRERKYYLNHLLALLPEEMILLIRENLSKKKKLNFDFYSFPEVKSFQKYTEHRDQNFISPSSGKGFYIDLNRMGEEIREKYFPEVSLPEISWSENYSIRLMGCYYPLRNKIRMSLIFDNKNIDQELTKYILFHEILHKFIGSRTVNGRRYCHTPEFKRTESTYPRRDELERYLLEVLRNPVQKLL